MPQPKYSRAEYLSDAVVHVVGLIVVVASVPILITVTAFLRGDAAAITGASIYGATLILMILCSALYNMVQTPRWRGVLRRLDHSAIYLKIAGTYTPFVLLTGQGLTLIAGLWAAAFAGVGLKVADPARFRWLALGLYLGMGWVGIVAGGTLLSALTENTVTLMLIGGVLYTLGVIFHLWERLPFHNTIWHIFVLVASLVFYAAITVQVVTGA